MNHDFVRRKVALFVLMVTVFLCVDSLEQMLVMCSLLILLILGGLSIMEAGAVHMKNTSSVIFKNIIIVVTSALAFYAVGFGLANGTPGNEYAR